MIDPEQDIFYFNLQFLSPSLQERLLSKKNKFFSQLHPDISVFPSRKGSPTLKWKGKNLHSNIDPIREACRRIEGVVANKYSVWVYLGADLLYSLEALDSISHSAKLILIFLNENFLYTVLSARRLSVLKKFSQVEWVTLEERENLLQVLKQSLDPSTWILTNEVLYNEVDDLKKLKKRIEEHTRMLMSSFFTRYYFDKRWMKNLIRNWEFSFRVLSLSSLQDQYRGEKAVLVGAGISLGQHLSHVKTLCEQGYYLVAVDTSLPVLLAQEISPNMIIALDGGYPNAGDFFRMPGEDTLLITYPHLYPSVIRDFPGPISYFVFLPNHEAGMSDVLLSHWVEHCGEGGGITRSGNVSVVAAEILSVLGFAEVVLSGIDFLFPFFTTHLPSGMHHQYYLSHQNRLQNLDTMEFQEVYERMTEEDKIQLIQQKGWSVSTLLSDHAFREWRNHIRNKTQIDWYVLPSPYSQLNGELPLAKIPSQNSKKLSPANPKERLQSSPMMTQLQLKRYLMAAQKTILTAQEYLVQEFRHVDDLGSKLKDLGWNLYTIYRSVMTLYSGPNIPNDKTDNRVVREIGNILAMMQTRVSHLLKKISKLENQ